MIMPTKLLKPVDSLVCIGAFMIKILKNKECSLDKLFLELNKIYYKKISFDKFILTLNFLNTINKVVINNEIVKLNL